MAIDWAGLKQYYSLQNPVLQKIASVKPGETIQNLKDRLGIGTTEAKTATTQGTGSFVPTKPLPITTKPTSALPLPGVSQPVPTTQPIVQQPVAQPTVQPQAPAQPSAIPNFQEQINALMKTAQGIQTEVAKGITPTVDAYGRALGEKTYFEQYAEATRKAQEPRLEAMQKQIDTLANLPSSADQYAELAKQKGIPELEGKIKDITGKAYGVEAQLEALPEDVKKRVQDFLITQSQYERLTTAEAKPLSSLYNALSRAQGLALQDLEFRRGEVNTMLGLVEKDTQRKLQALELGTKLAGLGAETEAGLVGKAFEEATKTPSLLSVTEAQTLGVPYGTTKEQASAMGITPTKTEAETASIKEYNLAQQQGFTGSFQQWQDRNKGQFSELESRKLEQAGLSGASRQQQLDFLYGQEQRIQELLKKSNFGANLEVLTPDEMADLYANL